MGWLPELHVLVLGTLGVIPQDINLILRRVGVVSTAAAFLKQKLHFNAIEWMDKCIDREVD